VTGAGVGEAAVTGAGVLGAAVGEGVGAAVAGGGGATNTACVVAGCSVPPWHCSIFLPSTSHFGMPEVELIGV
jgi:hypothetical protein